MSVTAPLLSVYVYIIISSLSIVVNRDDGLYKQVAQYHLYNYNYLITCLSGECLDDSGATDVPLFAAAPYGDDVTTSLSVDHRRRSSSVVDSDVFDPPPTTSSVTLSAALDATCSSMTSQQYQHFIPPTTSPGFYPQPGTSGIPVDDEYCVDVDESANWDCTGRQYGVVVDSGSVAMNSCAYVVWNDDEDGSSTARMPTSTKAEFVEPNRHHRQQTFDCDRPTAGGDDKDILRGESVVDDDAIETCSGTGQHFEIVVDATRDAGDDDFEGTGRQSHHQHGGRGKQPFNKARSEQTAGDVINRNAAAKNRLVRQSIVGNELLQTDADNDDNDDS